MNSPLTAGRVADYARDGYLIVKHPIFSSEKFARAKAYCASLFDTANEGGNIPAIIDCPHWRDPRMFEWIFADEMLDLVEPLIGPDIGVFACHLLQKPAGTGKRVPWHEDSAYWRGVLDPMTVASVTLALEPCLTENGCLRVVPGTHLHGYSDYAPVKKPEDEVFGIEIKRSEVLNARAADIVLQPNEASVHHGKIIHGSNPNTGTLRRAVLTVRYFPTTVRFVSDAHEYFKQGFHIYLARGRDHAGNRYSDPTQSYAKNEKVSTA